MLNKLEQLRKDKNSGFTIIEVMIVLAIAGLILLIVLLAVPALQRNSRNTQIKNDAANIVGSISTFASDNDGKIPDEIEVADGQVTLTKGTTESKTEIQAGTEVITVESEPTDDSPGDLEPGNLAVQFNKTCNGGNNTRSVAVYYMVETSGEPIVKCTNS